MASLSGVHRTRILINLTSKESVVLGAGLSIPSLLEGLLCTAMPLIAAILPRSGLILAISYSWL